MKKFYYICFYGIYLLLILVLVDYFFYRAYINRINIVGHDYSGGRNSLPTINNVDFLTTLRLGYISTDKKSCFTNFNEKKGKNIIRIGCFGDSFTRGDEVSEIYDYPSLLQDILNKAGYSNFEVINFGSAWYGFSQTFIMWKYIGRKYDLDCVLFGPATFNFYERETTFNHTKNTQGINIDYMHARFILKNRNLELVDVYGDTYKNRAQNYFRFIPLFRYLRYDTNVPPFLDCLLPRGKQLRKNPFYYYKGKIENEVQEIHKLLLLEIANSGKQIILGNYSQNVIDLAGNLKRKNFITAYLYCPEKFPYRMLYGHNSPWGNHFLAQQIFNLLSGKKTSPLYIMETSDIGREASQEFSMEKYNLSEYKDIKIEINNVVIGHFLNTYQEYFGPNEQLDLKQNKIVSFLAIKKRGDSILDAVLVPLSFNLRDNLSLSICFSLGNNKKKIYPIGKIEQLSPRLEIGSISLEGINISNRNAIEYKVNLELLKNCSFLGEKPKITILLNDKTILRAVSANHENGLIEFQPINNKLIVIRPESNSFVDVSTLDETGVIYLSLYTCVGNKLKVPFAKWIKKQYNFFPK